MKLYSNYLKYRSNPYSQNGEDGILAKLLQELEIKSGVCVEFGASNGPFFSNTYNLLNKNFSAFYIESDSNLFNELKKNTKYLSNVTAINRFVSHQLDNNSLDSILTQYRVPKDFEILSIDIDSYDLQVWQNYSGNPKIVIIEINSTIKPGILNYHNQPLKGNSFSSTLLIGKNKGYILLAHTGNLIFLRKDLINKSSLGLYQKLFPKSLFLKDWLDKPYWKKYFEYHLGKLLNKFSINKNS